MVEIDRIKILAKENGVSLSFLCSKLGKQRGYLKDIGLGKGSLSENQLAILAEALNTTPEYLHGKTDKKEKSGISAELSISDIQFINRVNKLDPDLQRVLIAASQLDSEDLKALADIAERLVSSARK